jgi:hypothetical protein
MNQFFNFNRFSLLVAKHWADNKKRYLLSVLAFIGLLIGWFIFTILVDSRYPMGQGLQLVTYFFSLFTVGSFYASQYFRDLGSRSKGINFLLVPASSFEKVLCGLLYTVLLFFVVFTLAFYLVDVLMITITKNFITPDIEYPAGQKGLLNVFEAAKIHASPTTTFNVLWIYFSIQSVFLLGSVYFQKYSFIKTIIGGFVIFFLLFCYVYFLYDMMPKGDYANGVFTSYIIKTSGNKDNFLVQLPGWLGQVLYYLFMYGTAPFLYLVTYFRLKEKQV